MGWAAASGPHLPSIIPLWGPSTDLLQPTRSLPSLSPMREVVGGCLPTQCASPWITLPAPHILHAAPSSRRPPHITPSSLCTPPKHSHMSPPVGFLAPSSATASSLHASSAQLDRQLLRPAVAPALWTLEALIQGSSASERGLQGCRCLPPSCLHVLPA